ncbi:MAG: hypothetical protein FJ095_07175 [Deltaproteobacteria bacterium]|nr:hypothetical protein [Deltaproteobacteria bacterium]
MRLRNTFHACTALAAVALLGCPNAEGEFNDFQDRYDAVHPDTASSSSTGASCAAPAAGDADGDYVFALSASLDPASPVRFAAKVATSEGASGLEVSFTLQALDTCDRTTPVGEIFDLGPFAVAADGSFTAAFPPLEVTGLSNPFSENPITAEVTLTGNLCAASNTICGALGGNVTKPSVIKLDGSNFRFDRLEATGEFPDVVALNCAGDLSKTKLPSKCAK